MKGGRKLSRLTGLVLTAVALFGCAPGGPVDPGASGSESGASFKLYAGGSDAEFSSRVEYKEFEVETKFEVTISGGPSEASVDVFINGQLVLTVVLDAAGAAHVEFSTRPDDSEHLPLPAEFPQPNIGDIVAIGPIVSTFQLDSSGDDSTVNGSDIDPDDSDNASNSDDKDSSIGNGGNDDATIIELRAEMTAGSLHAEAKYEEETDRTKFEVEVVGGQPGASFDVILAGVVITTMTLDAMGTAHVEFSNPEDDSGGLPFPGHFVVPVAGDLVTVGSLRGILADRYD